MGTDDIEARRCALCDRPLLLYDVGVFICTRCGLGKSWYMGKNLHYAEKNNQKSVFELIDDFNNTYFKNWKDIELIFYTNAIAGEVGELCNLVKKEYGGGTNNDMTVDKLHEHMLDEIADIYIYLIMISKKLGVGHSQETFDDVIRHKLNIIKDRMEKKSFKTKTLPELGKKETITKPNSQL